MPRGDYGPGAFTAQVGLQSVQYRLKGMSHAEAIAELECIAYPCDRGKDCGCGECETFRMHPEGTPEFHPIDHTVDICQWLDLEEIQQDRREALRRIKTRERLEREARAVYEERVQVTLFSLISRTFLSNFSHISLKSLTFPSHLLRICTQDDPTLQYTPPIILSVHTHPIRRCCRSS